MTWPSPAPSGGSATAHHATVTLHITQVDDSRARRSTSTHVNGTLTGSWDTRAAGARVHLTGTLGGQPRQLRLPGSLIRVRSGRGRRAWRSWSAMITRWISLAPSQIRSTRSSRVNRSATFSRM